MNRDPHVPSQCTLAELTSIVLPNQRPFCDLFLLLLVDLLVDLDSCVCDETTQPIFYRDLP